MTFLSSFSYTTTTTTTTITSGNSTGLATVLWLDVFQPQNLQIFLGIHI
jgi:hypothetical protein